MDPLNQGAQVILVFILVFEIVIIISGCLTLRCLQIFHRDIQETTDHFTNRFCVTHIYYITVYFIFLCVCGLKNV